MSLTCEQVGRQLAAYGDGELDLAQSLLMETHLAGCPACSADMQTQRDLRRLLRDKAPYYRISPDLRARLLPVVANSEIRAAARPDPVSRRTPRWHLPARWALPLAASVALAIGIDRLNRDARTDDALIDQVVDSHVRSMMVAHLDDVASSDHHTVKPWFAGKLDYSPPIPELAALGFPLAGGRLDYVDHRAVAALDYRRGGHIINVFVWPAAEGATRDLDATRRSGFNIDHWTSAGMTWWVVSDLNARELAEFVDGLRGSKG